MPGALDGLGQTASDLVTKFGKSAVLTRITLTQNQLTGTSTKATTTEPVIITPPAPFTASRREGSTIQKGDSITSVAALDVAEPAIGDRLAIGSQVFQIVDVGTVWSGENAALYELGLDN